MRLLKIVLALLLAPALAMAAWAQPAKPPRVVINLTDGKTVSGELVEATPVGVTLRPNPKAEPVMTPWSSIKRVGSGLTRAQVVDEWRKTKPELLCETCNGGATTQCSTCDGLGVEPTTKQPCDKCEATGSTGKCRTPNCVEGKIPCPNTCLKPESFTGPAGQRKKTFRTKNGGSKWWSEAHVGELIVYENGDPVSKGKCPRCEGTSRIVDAACAGSGTTTCVTCRGHGVVGPDCATCDDGKMKCQPCNGTGLKPADAATPPAN